MRAIAYRRSSSRPLRSQQHTPWPWLCRCLASVLLSSVSSRSQSSSFVPAFHPVSRRGTYWRTKTSSLTVPPPFSAMAPSMTRPKTQPNTEEDPAAVASTPASTKVQRKRTVTTEASSSSLSSSKRRSPRKPSPPPTGATTNGGNDSDAATTPAPRAKRVAHQVLTERVELPRLWDVATARAKGSHAVRIASWNVAGLRGLLRNYPDALAELATKHDLDILCLQETKLQEMHVDDPKLKLRGHLLEEQGYDAYYSCSTERKGYAGTAVFIRRQTNGTKKQPTLDAFLGASKTRRENRNDVSDIAKLLTPSSIQTTMGIPKHDTEGRIITVDFPLFTLCNVYVPNSGQNLNRLQYRINEWDKDFLAFMENRYKERGVPVMWLGDLNVAHTHLEVWNDGAKHLLKQAGVTPEERASFQQMLDAGWIDAFRRLHPTAKGHYTYWSQRAGNREPNKGLRLDYFICHPSFFDEASQVFVRDSYMVADHLGSDHCPVILELEIRSAHNQILRR